MPGRSLLLPAVMLGAAFVAAGGTRGADTDGNWPQWRGPGQNGVARSADVPATWSLDSNIVWKTELPSWSGGTPIVWGDRIFVTSPSKPDPEKAEAGERTQSPQRSGRRGGRRGSGRSPGGDALLLLCISKTDGEVLWERVLDRGNALHRKGNNTSPSPVTDGAHVWAVTGTGAVVALDMDGNEKWRYALQEKHGTFGLMWGYASSPLLHDGMLIVEVLHGFHTDDPSYVIAFDANTGAVRWRQERPTDAPRESPDAYTTPIVHEVDGKAQIVITGGDYVTAHDPETGAELWRAGGLNPRKAGNYRIVASPLSVDGMIYAPTRVNPLLALRCAGGKAEIVWTWNDTGSPDVPTPACDGRRFYMLNDSGLITCLDARTGAVIWGPERTVRGNVSSSPLLASGRVYFTNEEGVTVVVSAGDEFELIATNELDGSYTLSSPVPTGDKLLIRTGTHLYCIGEKKIDAKEIE